ncbi:MAG: radical SAM family heme chaperone HemW [Microbacteriaceae bacterium]
MAKQPDGEAAPLSGELPPSVLLGAESRDFGLYLHVPFCRVRCGYCDFNTYTATELPGVHQNQYSQQLIQELAFAEETMSKVGLPARKLSSVFIGGGTPTLLPFDDLGQMLKIAKRLWGFAPDIEVTVEANPDTVGGEYLQRLSEYGVTRVSIGMQSAVPEVLATLDRTHNPENVATAVAAAKAAGLQISVDLIYGAPGETLEQWRQSVETALSLEPDHISAYALIVEDGTKLARQIRRGEVPAPDNDLQAEMYELADAAFSAAGFSWYELSNWSRSLDTRSKHNRSYWSYQDWWGAGPGAHSNIGGLRWWNLKHPVAWSQRIAAWESPAAAREILDADQQYLERVLLETRLAEGMAIDDLLPKAKTRVAGLIADGLIEGKAAINGRVQLSLKGRLLADVVVLALTDTD